jgi:hypothetical protein
LFPVRLCESQIELKYREDVIYLSLKAAFIFLAPQADPSKHLADIQTPEVTLLVRGVQNYEEAVKVAKQLVTEGVQALELCGGFGNIGTAKIVEAVEHKIPVGTVRFDCHPGLGGKSGDDLF